MNEQQIAELRAKAEAAKSYASFMEAQEVLHDFRALATPDAILELIAELEAMRKDAQRYRWLRDEANNVRTRAPLVFNCEPAMPLSWLDALHGEALDAVVDARMDAIPRVRGQGETE